MWFEPDIHDDVLNLRNFRGQATVLVKSRPLRVGGNTADPVTLDLVNLAVDRVHGFEGGEERLDILRDCRSSQSFDSPCLIEMAQPFRRKFQPVPSQDGRYLRRS